MSNRWLRFVIALLAIVVSIAAGVRISQLEQQLGSDVSKSRAGEAAAQTAIESIGDLKAALHAYVSTTCVPWVFTTRTCCPARTRAALPRRAGMVRRSAMRAVLGAMERVASVIVGWPR